MIQTDASFKVLSAFIRYLMGIGESREACRTILGFEHVLRDHFYRVGVYTHVTDRVSPIDIVSAYLNDATLDIRWRERLLAPMIARLHSYEATVRRRLDL
ncbi:hypothetical protein FQZ97_1047360 [compost metagenome]